MSKLHVFRLGNSLLLGLIVFLTGSVFFLSNGARGDSFGTDCPPDWDNITGFCFTDKVLLDTGQTSCATSPSGLCCTYEGYKVACSGDTSVVIGSAYRLKQAGTLGVCDRNYFQCALGSNPG